MTYRSLIILGALLLALAGCVAAPAGPAPVAVETPAAVPAGRGEVALPLPTPPLAAAAPALTAAAPLTPTLTLASAETPAAAPGPAPAAQAEPLSAHLLAAVSEPPPSAVFALSPDGALLAYSTRKDERYQGIAIMDAAAGVELRRIAAETSSIRAISFSADSQRLLAVHEDGTLRIWDVAAGVEAAQIADVGSDGEAALSPDGGRVLVSKSQILQIWDVATGALAREIATGQIYPGGGWTADGKTLFALRPQPEARQVSVAFWDAATGDLLSTIPERAAEPDRGLSVQIAAVSADGGRVIVAGPYVTRIIDRQTGRELFHLAGWDAALAAGADRLATRDYLGQVRLWDSRTGELLVELGQADNYGCNCIAISADGRRIAARARGDENNAINIWEVRGQAAPRPVIPAAAVRQALKLAEPPASAGVRNPYPPAISQDGRTAVWNTGGAVIAWDLATGRRTYSGQITPRPADNHIFSDMPGAAFADPSAAFLIANTADDADPAARIWRVGAAEPQWTFPAGEAPLKYSEFSRGAGWTWSGDGRRVALPDFKQGVAVWEPASGSVLRVPLPQLFVMRLALSAAGGRVVAALRDGRLLAYDVAGGSQLWAAALPENAFRALGALSLSPDGRRLVVAAEDLTVRVLDAATGAELAHGTGLRLAPNVVAWRSDGRYFVTGGDDLTAVIWDAATAQPVRRLPGHDEAVSGAAFTPDGKQVVTLTAAFTVQYWDVADLE